MLDDPRAREAVANFHRQWLGLVEASTTLTKDAGALPRRTRDELLPLLQAETEAFLDHVVFEDETAT